MKVSQILKEKGESVITTTPESTVFDAIQLMNQYHIGALVVVDKNRKLLGIVTERDIMRRCLSNPRPNLSILVRDLMTKELIVAGRQSHVQSVMAVMTNKKIRHLPIVEGEALVGIISIGDAVKTQLEEVEYENHLLVDYISHPQ